MTAVVIVGYGYWGPNLARNFVSQGASIAAIVDTSEERRALAARDYPHAHIDAELAPGIAGADAVVIAAPPRSHHTIALAAFAAGKHVLAEKPLAATLSAAREIMNAARQADRILMVDHTFVHAPAVEALAAVVRSGILGEIVYAESTRTNLANFDPSISVTRDLAVHDLSILDYLFGGPPALIAANGSRAALSSHSEFAFLTLEYNGIPVHIHVNCLSPVKMRRMVIGGTRGVVVYDDIEQAEKLRVYERADAPTSDLRRDYRSGPISVPAVSTVEPLSRVVSHFLNCIKTGTAPLSDAASALRILTVVEAAESLIAQNSRRGTTRKPQRSTN